MYVFCMSVLANYILPYRCGRKTRLSANFVPNVKLPLKREVVAIVWHALLVKLISAGFVFNRFPQQLMPILTLTKHILDCCLWPDLTSELNESILDEVFNHQYWRNIYIWFHFSLKNVLFYVFLSFIKSF